MCACLPVRQCTPRLERGNLESQGLDLRISGAQRSLISSQGVLLLLQDALLIGTCTQHTARLPSPNRHRNTRGRQHQCSCEQPIQPRRHKHAHPHNTCTHSFRPKLANVPMLSAAGLTGAVPGTAPCSSRRATHSGKRHAAVRFYCSAELLRRTLSPRGKRLEPAQRWRVPAARAKYEFEFELKAATSAAEKPRSRPARTGGDGAGLCTSAFTSATRSSASEPRSFGSGTRSTSAI